MQEAKLRYLRSGATPDVYALALPESGSNDPFGEERETPRKNTMTQDMHHATNRHERRAAAKRARSKR
jgi:hypothetical protein